MYILCRQLALQIVGLDSSYHGKIPQMALFLIDFPAFPPMCTTGSGGVISAQGSNTCKHTF